MTTRRGSQYSIQSDGAGLRGRIDPLKGKRKGKIPSGTESTQGSSLFQRQVPEMPMISAPELELSMSDSNRYKSHKARSDRHLHEPVQAVIHSVQGQGLRNVATNTPKSDELLKNPQKVPQRGGNSEILQWMESMIIQTSNQKDQGVPCQKEGGNQEEAPVASTSKPQVNPLPQEGKKHKKKNWRKPYSPSYRIPKSQKDAMDIVFNMARTLMEFKDKEEQRMRQPHFPKKKHCLHML
ncbi:hypothetical protein O181_054685 [Austropuccinia psidii MF-1]|uniref:Uncharacterized protein n=1 Tax=Austropuccinia psidii MF-1 TaxID=1389203 RepID=A0A9Q3E9A3_9BASI|nr:hypothetical protein [Austropuccinia psidii MF-1]